MATPKPLNDRDPVPLSQEVRGQGQYINPVQWLEAVASQTRDLFPDLVSNKTNRQIMSEIGSFGVRGGKVFKGASLLKLFF